MLKKYSLYILKSHKTLISIYSFICFIIFPLLMLVENGVEYNEYAKIGLSIYSIVLCAGVIIVPLISYYFHYNKRSVDVYYSLPIDKKDLFNIHYFIPLLTLYIPVIINYIAGIIILYIKNSKMMNLSIMMNSILMLLCLLLMMSAAYALTTFFIHKCNSFIDAIIIAGSSCLLPYMAYGGLYSIIDRFLVPTGIDLFDYLNIILKVFSPFYNVFNFIASIDENVFPQNHIFIIIYMVFISITVYILAKNSFISKKGEDASQITDHVLTYPLIINITSLCIISLIDFFDIESISGFIVSLSIIFVLFIVMNSIAKRKVLLNYKIIGKFILYIAIVIIVSLGAGLTDCFNLNNQLVHIDFDKVNVFVYDYIDDKYIELEKTYTLKDKEMIEELQNLQLKASEQFRNGTYDESESLLIGISVEYIGKDEEEYRYYSFNRSEIQHIIDDLNKKEMTQFYN